MVGWLRVSLINFTGNVDDASNVLVKGGGSGGDAPRQNHGLPPTSISSFAAHNFFTFFHPSFSSPELICASTANQNYAHILTLHPVFQINRPFHPKCLPKLLKRSPLPAARLQLAERHLLRRKKPARKPLRLRATKRNVTRREKKLTLHTSTKVRIASIGLIGRVSIRTCRICSM